MNRRPMSLFAVALLAASLAIGSPLPAQSGNELFQQALTKQRAEGKLDEAIALYQRIVREHAGDHALAAKALVQLGRAYERMGTTEARKAYERVVREYSDQQDAAKEARTRITALESGEAVAQIGTSGAATRMLFRSDMLGGATMTADGRSLIFSDSTGNLALRELRTGRVTRITHSDSDGDEFVDYASGSVDAQTFAYAWWNGPKVLWELRVADRLGGPPRVVISDSAIAFARPFGFTRDGKSIIAIISPNNGPSQLALVAVATGARRALVTFRGQESRNVALSPDGKYLLYDETTDSGKGPRDIRILTMATGHDTVLVQHPAADLGAMWTPGGTGVFFLSARSGSRAGWYVGFRDGHTVGNPTMVKADLAGASILGLGPDGVLYYTPSNPSRRDIYIAEIDSEHGNVGRTPEAVISRTMGSNAEPAWSQDGKFLVYVDARGPSVRVRAIDTGVESEVSASVTRAVLTPDNQSIIASFLNRSRDQVGLYKLDVKSGTSQTIFERPANSFAIHSLALSRDGRVVFYTLWDNKRMTVIRRDLVTGAERRIYPVDEHRTLLGDLALSPDGRWLAVSEDDRAAAGRPAERMKLISIAGESDTVRTLGRLHPGVASVSWAPDGRSLFALVRKGNGSRELWSVPTDASAPRKLNAQLGRNVMQAQMHPDGRRLAMRMDNNTSELWVAEHFLPARPERGKD